MPDKKRPPANPAREHRIAQEIVVDAYSEDERALGWYYHLEGKLEFPFTGRCVDARKGSPLKKGETVEVTALAPEDDCMHAMRVLVQVAAMPGRVFAVPLDQLQPTNATARTREAVADWCYWVARGHG